MSVVNLEINAVQPLFTCWHFIRYGHVKVDFMIWTDDLTFTCRIRWCTEEFMVDSWHKPKSSVLHYRAWQLLCSVHADMLFLIFCMTCCAPFWSWMSKDIAPEVPLFVLLSDATLQTYAMLLYFLDIRAFSKQPENCMSWSFQKSYKCPLYGMIQNTWPVFLSEISRWIKL